MLCHFMPKAIVANRYTHRDSHIYEVCSRLIITQALPAPAQCLFLRLFQRRRHWFRISTLQYTEVPDTSEAVAALTAAGFARTADTPTTFGVLASQFRAAVSMPSRCMLACELLLL